MIQFYLLYLFLYSGFYRIFFFFFFSARKRPSVQLSEEQKDYRAVLQKNWARYQRQQNFQLSQLCRNIFDSQTKALEELRLESEELYQAAIQPDENLLPIKIQGPVNTPPIKNYESPAEYHSIHILHIMKKSLIFNLLIVRVCFVFFYTLFTGWRLQGR